MEQSNETEKRKKFIINYLYWALIVILIFVLLKYCAPVITPFIIGAIVAVFVIPLVDFLEKKTKGKRTLWAVVSLGLFYVLALVLLTLFGIKIANWITTFVNWVPVFYSETLYPVVVKFINEAFDILDTLDPTIKESLISGATNAIGTLASTAKDISLKVVSALTIVASGLPGFLLDALFAIVSSFLITIDSKTIDGFMKKQFGDRFVFIYKEVERKFIETIRDFLKAYGLIMCITFVELLIGFLIIGQNNAIMISAGIALFDILPVAGCGGILIPWFVIDLIIGKYSHGIKIIIIYGIIFVIRQVIEPKIVGQKVGLNPLVTLVAMYAGTVLFGGIGLFGLPITLAIIKSLNDDGTIHLLK